MVRLLARGAALLPYVPSALLVLLFAWVFGPSFLEHLHKGLDPLWFHDDARIQVFPFYRYLEPEAWTNDYVGDYALSLIPIGHRVLMMIAGRFVPAHVVGAYLGYATFFVTLIVVAYTARRLTHRWAGWIAAATMVSSSLLMERVISGLPRAFAFPVMALALLWTIEGRVTRLAVVVVVGAAFYPVVGVASGLVLAVLLLGLPAADRGEAATWSTRKRLAVLTLTVMGSVAMLAPTMIATKQYGPRVKNSEFATYPEAGDQGTHGSEDRPPYPALLEEIQPMTMRTLVGEGNPIWRAFREPAREWDKVLVDGTLVLALLGLVLAARRRDDMRRVLAFAVGAALAHVVARVGAPYFYAPSRYLLYALVPALAVLVPAGLDAIAHGPTGRVARPWLHRLLGTALALIPLLALGGQGSTSRGLTFHINDDVAPLYQKIAELPPTTMLAGWPDDPMSNVPYVSRRRALMTGELHLGYHVGYLLEIRRRLELFMDAYFASSTAPIFRLRDELGVTHIFLDPKHLQGDSAPGYMPPIGAYVRKVADANRPAGFVLLKQLEQATVARNERFVVIDIAKLTPTP